MLMSDSCVATPSSANSRRSSRIGALVVDDEAGVDPEHPPVGRRHVVGVGVAAEPVGGLVQRYVCVALQHVRGGESRDPAADDSHLAGDVMCARLPRADLRAVGAGTGFRRFRYGSSYAERVESDSGEIRDRAKRRGGGTGGMCRSPLLRPVYPLVCMIGATTLTIVANAYFQLIAASGSPRTDRTTAIPATGGPWSPELQHGGPPNALLVHVAEQLAAARDRARRPASRCAWPPSSSAPFRWRMSRSRHGLRAARTAVLVDATLSAGGRDCLHGPGLAGAATPTPVCRPRVADPQPAARRTGCGGVGARSRTGTASSGARCRRLARARSGTVWARPRGPSSPVHGLTSLQRAALIGDSASGVSAELDWAVWSFLNIDLDVHLARPVIGDWLLLDARTTPRPRRRRAGPHRRSPTPPGRSAERPRRWWSNHAR